MKYKQRTLHSFWTLAQAALLSVVLASCGGGEGDSGDPAAASNPPGMSTTTTSALVEKACSNCGALDAHTYAGSGIGVRESVNNTSSAVETPISISG